MRFRDVKIVAQAQTSKPYLVGHKSSLGMGKANRQHHRLDRVGAEQVINRKSGGGRHQCGEAGGGWDAPAETALEADGRLTRRLTQ